jgi:hypothetical protein
MYTVFLSFVIFVIYSRVLNFIKVERIVLLVVLFPRNYGLSVASQVCN